jgi:hypothetical protein
MLLERVASKRSCGVSPPKRRGSLENLSEAQFWRISTFSQARAYWQQGLAVRRESDRRTPAIMGFPSRPKPPRQAVPVCPGKNGRQKNEFRWAHTDLPPELAAPAHARDRNCGFRSNRTPIPILSGQDSGGCRTAFRSLPDSFSERSDALGSPSTRPGFASQARHRRFPKVRRFPGRVVGRKTGPQWE